MASKSLSRPLELGKIEFARAVANVASELPVEIREELFANFGTLFAEINDRIDAAMLDHSKERITQVTKRLVERFRRDHRKRVKRNTVSSFLQEIEQHLVGATPQEESIRATIRAIRVDFGLGDAPLEDVDDFDGLKAKLDELIYPEKVISPATSAV
ncbi:hypothetical protein BH11ACT4_BH11ACT4_17610 [soil metagenome]